MNHLKSLGLALVAAAAITAFAGAGTASATVLCKAAPNKSDQCPTSPGHWPSGTKWTAEASNPTLSAAAFGVTGVACEKSNVNVKSTSAGGAGVSVPGEITELSFSGSCHTTGFIETACTVSSSRGYLGSISATSGGDGTLNTKSHVGTVIKCPGVSMDCTYYPSATSGVSLAVSGGEPAAFTASGAELESEGSGCPATATWDAVYVLTSNTNLWVAAEDQ